MKRFVFFGAIALFLTGCDALVSPSRYSAVEVEVASRHGVPAPGVHLTLYTGLRPMQYATTNADGRFVFERVPEGPAYGVSITAPEGWSLPERIFGGPATSVVVFPLPGDTVRRVQFTLVKLGPAVIIARVTDDAGAALPGALVTLYTPFALVSVLPTDQHGEVTFHNVLAGIYGVSAERPAAHAQVFAEERAYSPEIRVVEEGDTVRAAMAFTRIR